MLRTFIQLFKFGISGIAGVAISTVLFYGFKGRLPELFYVVWLYRFDAPEVMFYILTSVIGGSVHFVLSKLWVFESLAAKVP